MPPDFAESLGGSPGSSMGFSFNAEGQGHLHSLSESGLSVIVFRAG